MTTWHTTTPPPDGRYLVTLSIGTVHEAWHITDADIAPMLVDGRWRISDETEQRRALRTGSTVTAWAMMPARYVAEKSAKI
jgi:hypothetical protein